MADLEKLRKFIDNSGLKYTHIAIKLNLSRECLYNKLDGKTEFKVSEVNKLRKILNMDNDTINSIFFGIKSELNSREKREEGSDMNELKKYSSEKLLKELERRKIWKI